MQNVCACCCFTSARIEVFVTYIKEGREAMIDTCVTTFVFIQVLVNSSPYGGVIIKT